jgi:hypothetical protein
LHPGNGRTIHALVYPVGREPGGERFGQHDQIGFATDSGNELSEVAAIGIGILPVKVGLDEADRQVLHETIPSWISGASY